MRRSLAVVLMVFGCVAGVRADKPRKPAPPKVATEYPFHDEHAQVVIAAEPGDTRATQPDTRLDYGTHDMLPMRVIVTNNSDKPLTLDDARIDLILADNTKITAATTDDLNRRMFAMKQVEGTRIPLIPVTIHHPPVDTKIMADDADFGFKTTTVAAHATVAGYLYYDTQGMAQPVLKGATLELRKVRWKIENSAVLGDALDSFEIPLAPADVRR